ncbi:hypothetical protein AB0C34_24890 [Nocardia sp. NPDC049220]|uniref:hypothetical protein n=1 Tax=Nocardia sp. NPDC049220 TaxID=3155273 RepID=UPI0033E52510
MAVRRNSADGRGGCPLRRIPHDCRPTRTSRERPDLSAHAPAAAYEFAESFGTIDSGAAVGRGVGSVGGAVFGAPILDAGGRTLIAGCLAGAGVLAGPGAIVNAVVLGVPVGIAAAIEFQNTMSRPYDEEGAHGVTGTRVRHRRLGIYRCQVPIASSEAMRGTPAG